MSPADKQPTELVEELQNRLDGNPKLAEAFAALTPGRQREYNFHIAQAKQAKTRESRIDKCVPKILAGLGFRELDDDGKAKLSAKMKAKKKAAGDGPVLLSGGNPQIPKGDGPEPVNAYLDAMPGWKQGVGRELDALIERVVPEVRRAVRWNSPFYGVEGRGWFASYHCFDRYIKVTFLKGSQLDPEPPESSKDPDARYAHIYKGAEIDVSAFEGWMRQAAAIDGWDGF